MPERYCFACPPPHVDHWAALFLVVYGAPGAVVPVEHSRRLVAALRAAGAEVTYEELPTSATTTSPAGLWNNEVRIGPPVRFAPPFGSGS